jgi:hypothetical protein
MDMPRFMGFVKMAEGQGPPPQALMDAMDEFVGEHVANGVFLDGGGLFGTEDAVNFVVRNGEATRVDGPYAEAKEVVGGWAILQYDNLDQAVAGQKRMVDLHLKYWPEVDFVVTVREISDGPPEA